MPICFDVWYWNKVWYDVSSHTKLWWFTHSQMWEFCDFVGSTRQNMSKISKKGILKYVFSFALKLVYTACICGPCNVWLYNLSVILNGWKIYRWKPAIYNKKGLFVLIFHGSFWYQLLSLTLTYPAGGKEGTKNTFLFTGVDAFVLFYVYLIFYVYFGFFFVFVLFCFVFPFFTCDLLSY